MWVGVSEAHKLRDNIFPHTIHIPTQHMEPRNLRGFKQEVKFSVPDCRRIQKKKKKCLLWHLDVAWLAFSWTAENRALWLLLAIDISATGPVFPILVLYGCVTYYHKVRGWKPYPVVITQLLGMVNATFGSKFYHTELKLSARAAVSSES